MKEYGKALEDYEKVIQLKPEARANRALLYQTMGEQDKALEDYNKTIELVPNKPNIYFNRALLY